MKKLCILFLGCQLVGLSGLVHAESQPDVQSIPQLRTLALNYLQSVITKPDNTQLNITVGNIDPRLTLKSCASSKLVAYLPPGYSATSTSIVGIRCDGTTPWSIFIPVSITQTQQVMSTTRPLAAGTLLTAQDFQLTPININKLSSGSITDPNRLLGQRLKHPIGAGIPISPSDTEFPTVVKRGEPVSIEAINTSIRVSSHGVAMSDGRKGDNILVRNLSSNRQISGQVVGPGRVTVETQ